MGINVLIAALLSLFFWSKTTKDIGEKVQLASKTKTFVYCVLTIIVATFYYKTSQVATIYNEFEIDGVRENKDSLGKDVIVDEISRIHIGNKFSSGQIYGRESTVFEEEEDEKSYVYIEFSAENRNIQKIKSGYDVLNYNPFWSDKAILYGVSIFSNSIPHLYPFLPSINKTKVPYNSENDNAIGFTAYISSDIQPEAFQYQGVGLDYRGKTDIGDKLVYKNDRYCSQCLIAPKKVEKKGKTHFGCKFSSEMSNKLDFFTAADLSQYIHSVHIKSEIPVREILFSYDVPVELSINDPYVATATSLFMVSKELLDTKDEPISLLFHVKLPTLANLQMIRSLILTTILAALVSLFFSNLYLVIRKKALAVKDNNVKEISESKVKVFKRNMIILLVVVSSLLLLFAGLLLCDIPLHLPNFFFKYAVYIIIILFLLIAIFVLYQFRKAYSIAQNTKNKKMAS